MLFLATGRWRIFVRDQNRLLTAFSFCPSVAGSTGCLYSQRTFEPRDRASAAAAAAAAAAAVTAAFTGVGCCAPSTSKEQDIKQTGIVLRYSAHIKPRNTTKTIKTENIAL